MPTILTVLQPLPIGAPQPAPAPPYRRNNPVHRRVGASREPIRNFQARALAAVEEAINYELAYRYSQHPNETLRVLDHCYAEMPQWLIWLTCTPRGSCTINDLYARYSLSNTTAVHYARL